MIAWFQSRSSSWRAARTGLDVGSCVACLLLAPCGASADSTGGARTTEPPEVLSFSPQIRAGWGRAQLGADAAFHGSRGAASNADGRLSADVWRPLGRGLRGALAFQAGTTSWTDAERSGRVQVIGTTGFGAGITTAWIGAGAARSWSGGRGINSGILPAGVSIQAGSTQVRFRSQTNVYTSRTSFMKEVQAPIDTFPPVPGVYRLVESEATRVYTDASVGLGWFRGRVSLGADVGARLGSHRQGSRLSGRVEAGLGVTPRLALVAQGGKQPSVPEQGLPAHNFATLGLQLNLTPAGATAPESERGRGRDAARFALLALDGGRCRIRILLPDADRVELAGDFTNWIPVPMSFAGRATWEVILGIDPGPHRMNIRVDGGPWIAPPGLDAVEDEFNGRVGLFVAP